MRGLEKLEDRRLLTTYTVTDLSGAGLDGLVADLNDLGQVVGTVAGHAVRWQNGVATDLGTLGGPSSAAAGINGRGDVVGTASSAESGPSLAFLWKEGVVRDLGLGADSAAVAVNDAGVVAANAGGRAVVWRDGVVTDLGDLGGGGAAAADINNDGTVVGSSWAGGYDGALGLPSIHAFIWRDGVMTDLGTPGFTLSSYPSAVNNAGQIVGSSTYYANTGYGAAVLSRSFFYDGTQMVQLPVPGLQSYAADINDAGVVIGTMWGGTMSTRAYVYEGGVVSDVNTLLAPGSNTVVTGATAINNAGQILAYNSSGRPVLLTPDTPDTSIIIDDGGEGFATAGPHPAVLTGQGYGGDASRLFAPGGTMSALLGRTAATRRLLARLYGSASWTFGALEPGIYRVSATWTAGADRASDAAYTVQTGTGAATAVPVNQKLAPSDYTAHGASWDNLGTFDVTGGMLTVRLGGRANGRLIADAVCVERVGPATSVPVAPPATSLTFTAPGPAGATQDLFSDAPILS